MLNCIKSAWNKITRLCRSPEKDKPNNIPNLTLEERERIAEIRLAKYHSRLKQNKTKIEVKPEYTNKKHDQMVKDWIS